MLLRHTIHQNYGSSYVLNMLKSTVTGLFSYYLRVMFSSLSQNEYFFLLKFFFNTYYGFPFFLLWVFHERKWRLYIEVSTPKIQKNSQSSNFKFQLLKKKYWRWKIFISVNFIFRPIFQLHQVVFKPIWTKLKPESGEKISNSKSFYS